MATTAPERFVTLDVIRGIAVMGIFSVNVVDFSTINAAYLNPAALGWPEPASLFVWAANMLLVDGKLRTLFSMLFGASMLLVIERAEAAGRSGWGAHWRRMAVLLGFGVAHAILVWRGDILTLYAVTGLVAFTFREKPVSTLIAWGVIFSLANMALFGAIGATLVYQDTAVHVPGASAQLVHDWNANLGSFYPTPDKVARDLAIYGGAWSGVVAHEASKWSQLISNTLLILPDTLGLMLFGMAAYKSGFLTGAWEDRRYRRIAAWGIALGLAGYGALVAADLYSHFYFPLVLTGFMTATAPFRIVMAFGYAAVLILFSRPGGAITKRIAAVGRAAFTNYLGTSIVCTAIFYGWGLGLYGKVTRAEAWLAVPLVWALMLLWSKPWLDRFAYGPFEWAWRSLARGKLQPMRNLRHAELHPASMNTARD
ncbi:MAG TPA: DUF418 domain-containing protein [Sphingomicrobium sp.]|nr:DUF418 domain-containing protein [Sphingomicrobium sp.]